MALILAGQPEPYFPHSWPNFLRHRNRQNMDKMLRQMDDIQTKHKYLENKPKIEKSYPEMDKFIEMCFESGTPMNERLKDTLKQMMREDISEYK